jgi:hypothetical protein
MIGQIAPSSDGSLDPETLWHLGPLRTMAGLFISHAGRDWWVDDPTALVQEYRDEIVLSPIDPVSNGSQILYGLRYLQHVRRHSDVAMLHDQVGYWLYEPATSEITLSLATPRAQVALANGTWQQDSDNFTVRAERGASPGAFMSSQFLEKQYRTVSFEMTVTLINEDSWQYSQETHVEEANRAGILRLRNEATLVRISAPTTNPAAQLP